jgi:hypothetical protein
MGATVDRFAHNSFALLTYASIFKIYGLQLPSFDRSQGLWGFIGSIQSLLMTFGLTFAACLIGIRIPDWIDSEDRPGHRGFGHSLLSLFIFAFIALIVSGYFVDKDLALGAGLRDVQGCPLVLALDEKYFLDLDSAKGLLVGSLGFLAFVLSIYLLADRFLVAIVLLLRAG